MCAEHSSLDLRLASSTATRKNDMVIRRSIEWHREFLWSLRLGQGCQDA